MQKSCGTREKTKHFRICCDRKITVTCVVGPHHPISRRLFSYKSMPCWLYVITHYMMWAISWWISSIRTQAVQFFVCVYVRIKCKWSLTLQGVCGMLYLYIRMHWGFDIFVCNSVYRGGGGIVTHSILCYSGRVVCLPDSVGEKRGHYWSTGELLLSSAFRVKGRWVFAFTFPHQAAVTCQHHPPSPLFKVTPTTETQAELPPPSGRTKQWLLLCE